MANGEWVDNGNSMTTSGLNRIINDRSAQIHRIDEDIEKLEQAIRDIDHAIECFRKSSDDMQLLEGEVALVFKGEAAESFQRKLVSFSDYCMKRIQHMEALKVNYSKQIADLQRQKQIAQALINRIRELLDRIRNIELRSK